jgi:uncharacterized protein (DUF302 family)
MSFMRKMMFTVHRSKLDFEETVEALRTSAQEHGWEIPMEHDLQENYQNAGYEEMTRVTTLYFCTPDGGYQILRDDDNTPMAVMMPMGVSVYETQEGEVFIAGMNLEQMSMMFGGAVKEVLLAILGALHHVDLRACAQLDSPVFLRSISRDVVRPDCP